jgi:hypothetical protein
LALPEQRPVASQQLQSTETLQDDKPSRGKDLDMTKLRGACHECPRYFCSDAGSPGCHQYALRHVYPLNAAGLSAREVCYALRYRKATLWNS